MKIKVVIDQYAYMPKKAHDVDAGFDIRTPVGVVVPPRGSATVDTGVHIEIPEGYVGFLKFKSGLNVNHGLSTEGVIDTGYTGSIVAKIYNNTDEEYFFMRGAKITQLVILPIPKVELIKVDKLKSTERGNKGFGSSGK